MEELGHRVIGTSSHRVIGPLEGRLIQRSVRSADPKGGLFSRPIPSGNHASPVWMGHAGAVFLSKVGSHNQSCTDHGFAAHSLVRV